MTQNKLLKSDAPKTIWLQVGNEPSSYAEANSCGDISWCADKIFDFDIEYRLVEPNTITITESEYAKLKADAVAQPVPSQSEAVFEVSACEILPWSKGKQIVGWDKLPICTKLFTKPQPTSQNMVDAELYRFMRDNDMTDIYSDFITSKLNPFSFDHVDLDVEIDAAMKEAKP